MSSSRADRALLNAGGAALIVVAICAAYFPALSGEFLMDDDKLVVDNRLVHSSDGLYQFWCTSNAVDYWPLTNSSFWLEWRLWGMNPIGYHVTNLLLHIAAALVLWAVLQKLTIPGAFLAALLFAVHPVNVESVAWIAQRKGLMALLFSLISILCYLRDEEQPGARDSEREDAEEEKGRRGEEELRGAVRRVGCWYWLSLLTFLLAMLSKGSVAILPLVVLVLAWWQRRRVSTTDLVRTVPFFVVAIALTAVNVWFQTHGTDVVLRDVNYAQRAAGAAEVVWFYLAKAMAPINLVFVYPQWRIVTNDLLWWLPALALLCVSLLLLRQRNSPRAAWGRALLFAWVFFCVALVPVLGFADVGFMKYSLVADHYQQLALIGVTTLAAAGWSIWQHRSQSAVRPLKWGVAVIIVGTLILLTWHHSQLYGDAIDLYRATLNFNPDSWLAHNNLAIALNEQGRPGEAIEHCQEALRLKSDYAEAHDNLANALLRMDRKPEAIEHFKQALQLNPESAEAHFNFGTALFESDRMPEAYEQFECALRLRPDRAAEVYCAMAAALTKADKPQEAIVHYEQALRIDPNYALAHNNLGATLISIGQPDKAIAHLQEAVRLQPTNVGAYANLGFALGRMGRSADAVAAFQESLRLKPDDARTHSNLGIALASLGRLPEAIEHYQQAIKLQPDYILAYANLANVLAQLQRRAEAIAVAEKALDLAQSQRQAAMILQLEGWLKAYRAAPTNPAGASSSAQSTSLP